MRPSQHRLESLSPGDQFDWKAVQPSCTLVLMGTLCRARRSASGFAGLYHQESFLELHCVGDPTLLGEGAGKGWTLGLLVLGLCIFYALRAAGCFFADPGIKSCIPFVAADITVPANDLLALWHYTIWSAIIRFVVPLSCNQGSLGS